MTQHDQPEPRVIGIWHDDGGLGAGEYNVSIQIVNKGVRYFEESFSNDDRQPVVNKLKYRDTKKGKRFDVRGCPRGDYFVIDKKTGDLRLYDFLGYIRTAKRVK